MNRSPLQLKHYHYRSLSLTACEDVDMSELTRDNEPYPNFEGVELLPEVTLFSGEAEDHCGPYLLKLAIKYENDEQSRLPYSFEVVIEGIFMLDSQTRSEEECERMVVINGASVLYSAAREQILTLSGRHLYGPMLLPTLNFQRLDLESTE